MKKINKFFSSCSKLTRCFAVALLAAVLVSGMISCDNASNANDDGNNGKGAALYPKQPSKSKACGAYSLAYYLEKTGQIEKSEIADKADEIYDFVKYPEDTTAKIGGKDYDFSGYSNPEAIAQYIKNSNAPISTSLKMLKDDKVQSQSERLLLAAKNALNISIADENRIDSFENGFNGCEYCIEILTYTTSSGKTTLHYVLTYKKGDEFYSLDPYDGIEYKRLEVPLCEVCNGGIFIKAPLTK